MITFDVGSDASRRQIHRLLGRYGLRVLYTAYEIHIENDDLDRLLEQLAEHVKPGDHLLGIPCCPHCESAAHGDPAEDHPGSGWVIQ